jgi:hypothetical protein
MRHSRCTGLVLLSLVSTVAGCGSSGAATAHDGSEPGSKIGTTSSSNVGTGSSSSSSAPKSSGGSTSSAGSDAAAGPDATAADAAPPRADASVVAGDAGAQPYKGVANSACNDLITLGATWYYNWETSPPCPTPAFVPMVWGHTGAEQSPSGITGEVTTAVSKGYSFVLGFNEPDNTGQSNISVTSALALWPSFNNPAVLLGSPATQANTTGQAWFTTFMDAVNTDTTGTLRVDFIAAHWYGWNAGSCDANANNLQSYIQWLEKIPGNRPIWLTEWGCLNMSNPDEATVQAFYSGAIKMFAKHPRLVRYAWYPWTTNNELVTSADALTSLGTAFAAAPQFK